MNNQAGGSADPLGVLSLALQGVHLGSFNLPQMDGEL
jgi:hypothetical protein